MSEFFTVFGLTCGYVALGLPFTYFAGRRGWFVDGFSASERVLVSFLVTLLWPFVLVSLLVYGVAQVPYAMLKFGERVRIEVTRQHVQARRRELDYAASTMLESTLEVEFWVQLIREATDITTVDIADERLAALGLNDWQYLARDALEHNELFGYSTSRDRYGYLGASRFTSDAARLRWAAQQKKEITP